MGRDDFAAAHGGAAPIGAQQGAPGGGRACAAHGETNTVADETQEALAGRRFHDRNWLRHIEAGVDRRTALRFRRSRRKATLLCRKKREKMARGLLLKLRARVSNYMATLTQNQGEEAQLLQTIEMFEVIVQSQPNDCQSLEILKEAYSKLGREQDVISTSKRIAQAYMQQGQFSSAILEYETVLQRRPDDADVQAALKQIEDKASNMTVQVAGAEPAALATPPDETKLYKKARPIEPVEVNDGRQTMQKIFVESKLITAGDFDLCWRVPDLAGAPPDVAEPFIYTLNEKSIFPLEKSLKLLTDKSRTAFIPLDRYDVDLDLTRGFPADVCRRWCVLPFDRMSKAIFVATANPFNQQAAKELADATSHRLLWYLAAPSELISYLRKAFR
jgi:tetratricopeptide (TPR) repeat protein